MKTVEGPVNESGNKEKQNRCSVKNGSCLTSNRMCPGFALLGAYILGLITTNFTGSETAGFVIGTIVFLGLISGIHSLFIQKLTRLLSKN